MQHCNVDIAEWKVRRRRTTIILQLHSFLYGLEVVSIVTSLMYYLEAMKVKNTVVFYSIVTSSMALAEAGSSVIIGRYMDKSRNLRRILLLNCLLSVIGNITYTMRFNVWFLVIGRFLCGFNNSMKPVVSGTYISCPEMKDFSNNYSIYTVCCFNINFLTPLLTPNLLK